MKTKVLKIIEKTNKLRDELHKIQNQCEHKESLKTYRSNADDYDRLDISYYTDFYCPTCLKSWSVDGSV